MGDTFLWVGGANGDVWGTAENWFDVTNNAPATRSPGKNDTASFTGNASVQGGSDVGTISIAPGASVSFWPVPGGATYSAGTLALGTGATLTLEGATAVQAGTADIGVDATLDISRGYYLGVSTMDPDPVEDSEQAEHFYAAPLTGRFATLTIEYDAASQHGGALVLGGNNVLVDDHFTNEYPSAGGGVTGTGHVYSPTGITLAAPCFVAGTLVETASGEVPVEMLRPGDMVRTERGRLAPVKWMGQRSVTLARRSASGIPAPVRILADAFAPGAPRRDLLLSADHAVLVGDILIPAHKLINGATIRAETGRSALTYVHVELDRHDLLRAEGLAAESYLDTGNRGQFDRECGVRPLFPDASTEPLKAAIAAYAALGCAPLVHGGEDVQRAHWRLLMRACGLGWQLTDDAALTLTADAASAPLVPMADADGLEFVVPGGTRMVHLRSRSFVPQHLDAGHQDPRRLGAAIAVWLDGVPLAEAAFAAGFYAPDDTAAWRWSDGDARLALEPRPAATRLRIKIMAAGARYWLPPAARQRPGHSKAA
ncbi:MAG: Hint domain-containing protein [Alphaproteobacteria bacterium]|nr:Hint domain-containing protein [Alphaproteobacteria bacterium]